jgi:hypothetical protein
MAAALVPLAFGPAAQDLGAAATTLALGLLGATALLLGLALFRDGRERARDLGILASLAATCGLVLAIGFRRSELDWENGLPAQYVTLTSPLLCAAFFAWEIRGRGLSRRLVPGAIALAALGLLPGNASAGRARFEAVRAKVADFEGTIDRGAGPAEILASYARNFRGDPQLVRAILRVLAEQRRPPFDGSRAVPAFEFDFPTFSRAPSRVEAPSPVEVRYLRRDALTVVAAGTTIHFDRKPGDARITGWFGVPAELPADLAVRIELRPKSGPPRTLLERTLRSGTGPDPWLQAFSVDLPPGIEGEIVLATEELGAPAGEPVRSAWRNVQIE